MLYKCSPSIDNKIFTKEFIRKQIIKRFLPNENYEEAKLKFKTHVENSHRSTYNSSFFIDFFHRGHSDIHIFNNKNNNKKKNKIQNIKELTDSDSDSNSNLSSSSNLSLSSSLSSSIYNYLWGK